MDTGDQLDEPKAIVQVLRYFREGEYGIAARYEFPTSDIVFEILVAVAEEKKKHKLYHFGDVIVASEYSPEVDQFLEYAGKKAGYILQIEGGDSGIQDAEDVGES